MPLPVHLDRRSADPLSAQLARQVRELLVGGTLRTGDRLPSTRALAAELAVSRSVTEQAYDQLLAEGWLETRRGAGTFVAPHLLAAHGADAGPAGRGRRATVRTAGSPPSTARTDTTAGRARRPGGDPATLVPLSAGEPWVDPRHSAVWRRAWREVSAATPPRGYGDPAGLPELRAALADRLATTRGLVVDADDVLVTAGSTAGLREVLAALPPGPVGVEDPGYRAAVATARDAGRTVVDLPAERRHDAAALRGLAAVYVTPAHQHPLGRVMPAADRLALLEAARATGTLVVEDDYDSELRYDVAPVPALAALDPTRVAYLGTASKSAPPGLRLGWAVLPDALHDAVLARRGTVHGDFSWPSQRAMVALLRDGWLDVAVRTARGVYAARAQRVAAALAPYATAAATSAGMYSTWLTSPEASLRARDAAARAGFGLNLLQDYCRSATLTGLVVGFGGVTDAELDGALAAVVAGLAGGPHD
ncbi:GntR family transcriptional regulator/MocR family aminotransferase [Isoptericola jiangsuensis]|uniref:GntR family transcriptional regulator/MocR family aminotransferase n=1 Tax=Isoptericola jiangsuensis TaxID=548579 RepID=A0A2A9ERE4_9MICO|nr:PLP-dependent aminotransferase family protein [Isoptericola jiangsuensis]PFG41707.1 GntR family transcriptional regulator/MocR family aminotransferase [Isoptericola jiangsuensis]